MIYLISQILLCLVLAAVLGGAVGWLLQRSRSGVRLDAARRALGVQARQLEQARTDVAMVNDDYEDLRERSRVELDALREENRELPTLAKNLERSQLLVRQMMQRHDSQVRELDASNATLQEQMARLQEQVVTQERALARAAKAARNRTAVPAGEPGAPSGAKAHDVSGERGEGSNGPVDDEAAGIGRAITDGGSPLEGASDTPGPAPADDGPDGSAGEPIDDGARGASPSRRGRASLPLVGGEPNDESMDEVMELDDDFAAELRENVEEDVEPVTEVPEASPRDGALVGAVTDPPTSIRLFADGADGATDDDSLDDALEDALEEGPDDAWDEDEDGNATLAIEVFSMDDVHGVDEIDGPVPPSNGPLFRPVERQDDLKRIVGIGAVTEKALNEIGITSYPQLAGLERPEIEKIADALEIGAERIERDDWVGSARRQLEDVLEEL